jgi:phage terminase large subunit GpA-like protein
VPVSINRKNKPIVKNGVNLYFVGYDESVKSLQYRLGVETVGPGYLHFGLCSTDQFLAELFPWRRMPRRSRGQISYHWEAPTGARDEGGDCTRYAYAVLQLVTRRYTPGTMWAQLARTLSTQAPGAGGGGVAPSARDPQRSGWLKGSSTGGPAKRKGWLKR